MRGGGELSDDYGVSEAGDRMETEASGLEGFEQAVGALGVARVGVGQAVVEEEQGLWGVAGRDWCAWRDRGLELLERFLRTRCDEAAAVGERGGAAQFSLLDERALVVGVLRADGKFCDAAGGDRNIGQADALRNLVGELARVLAEHPERGSGKRCEDAGGERERGWGHRGEFSGVVGLGG